MNSTIYYLLFFAILLSGYSYNNSKSIIFLNTPEFIQDFSPYSQPIPGSDQAIDLIPIPGGEFEMGPFNDDKVLKVHLDPFWIGKFEISWDQYDLFVKENISELDMSNSILTSKPDGQIDALSTPTPPYVDMSFGMGRDGYPAVNMTHYAAVMFTKWLYVKTGIFFRLPTEAEWEYACKANHDNFYSLIDNDELDRYAWHEENSERKYHKIGSKEPSLLGIHDLLGNVSEWTLDQYNVAYPDYFSNDLVENPFIKPESLYPRSVRGGSWMDKSEKLACTNRMGSDERWQRRDPQLPKSLWWLTDAPFLGFRIVRPINAPTEAEMQKYWIEEMESY